MNRLYSVVSPELTTEEAVAVPEEGVVIDRLAASAVFKLRLLRCRRLQRAVALDRLIRKYRPALGIVNRRVGRWAHARTFGEGWTSFRRKVRCLLDSVGRIEVKGYPVGTGFVFR